MPTIMIKYNAMCCVNKLFILRLLFLFYQILFCLHYHPTPIKVRSRLPNTLCIAGCEIVGL